MEASPLEFRSGPSGVRRMIAMQELPPIYWINLSRSTERRARMERELETRQLAHQRICAVDGLDAQDLAQNIRCRADNPKVAACLASHLVAIRTAHAQGHECALFMEDDASFELFDRWPFDLDQAVRQLPACWSGLWLGYGDTPRNLDALFRLQGLAVPIPGKDLWSTVAYVLHRRAMTHLLARFGAERCFDVSDFEGGHEADTLLLGALAQAPRLAPPWVLRVPLFTFEGRDSEIHDEDLELQRRARVFVLEAFDELCAGSYVPRFGVAAQLARLRRMLSR